MGEVNTKRLLWFYFQRDFQKEGEKGIYLGGADKRLHLDFIALKKDPKQLYECQESWVISTKIFVLLIINLNRPKARHRAWEGWLKVSIKRLYNSWSPSCE